MPRSLLITGALLGSLVFSAPPAPAAEPDLAAVNRALAERHILPGYRQLASAMDTLDRSARDFCREPTPARLSGLQGAFHDGMDAWQAIRHIRFGPVELLLRHHRFQLWPDKRGAVGRHLGAMIADADPKVENPDAFAETSVAVQGLSALEHLVFRGGADKLLEGTEQVYRCRLVSAISGNLSRMANDILQEWSGSAPGYLHQFTHPGPDNPWFDSHVSVSTRLLGSLNTLLSEMDDLKLSHPLDQSAERARPRRAESWRSARSLRNLRINLQAAQALYTANGSDGFSAILNATPTGADLDRQMKHRFAELAGAWQRLPGDALGPVLQGALRPPAEQAREQLRALRAAVANELAAALGLTIGFNSLDGD